MKIILEFNIDEQSVAVYGSPKVTSEISVDMGELGIRHPNKVTIKEDNGNIVRELDNLEAKRYEYKDSN